MKHILAKRLAAAGIAAAAGATAVPANADVVLTPRERVVVYRDLIAAPYPPTDGAYYYRDYAYSPPPAYSYSYYDYDYDYGYAPDWDVRVGAVVPAAVPLQPVPQTVAVPTVYGYDYAVIEQQVVLVEPRSRRIFEVLYETSQ